MRSRLYLIVVVLASTLLLAGLWLAAVRPVQAGDGCANTYVVKYGDTLYSIARRFDTTVSTLVRLNGIRNPNLIHVGQTLCLPGQPASAPTPAPPQIVLEATYVFTPTADEAEWPLAAAGHVGKRVVYPLAGIDALQTVTTTADLIAAMNDADPPVLWVAGQDPYYILVSIGEGEPLAALRISDTHVVTPFVPSPDVFDCPTGTIKVIGDPGLTTSDLTLWLESADGVRYPFPITGIAHADNLDQVLSCFYEDAIIALLPPSQEGSGYRGVMVLFQKGFGPPGPQWLKRCESWRGGGAFYRWLRAWYNCP